MTGTFGEKFEQALEDKKKTEPGYGLRTLARKLAKDDPAKVEVIRRRLHKYRPKPGGGAAEVAPTEPTRHELEAAMGLERDALKPDEQVVAAGFEEFLADIAPLHRLWQIGRQLESGQLALVEVGRAGSVQS